jgi:hypothetical protein
MRLIGEASASPTGIPIRKRWPSGETAYCWRWVADSGAHATGTLNSFSRRTGRVSTFQLLATYTRSQRIALKLHAIVPRSFTAVSLPMVQRTTLRWIGVGAQPTIEGIQSTAVDPETQLASEGAPARDERPGRICGRNDDGTLPPRKSSPKNNVCECASLNICGLQSHEFFEGFNRWSLRAPRIKKASAFE